MATAGAQLEAARLRIDRRIVNSFKAKGVRAANELKNASLIVLRGNRGGRSYIVPGTGRVSYNKRNKTGKIRYTRHTGSAPGEPPAVRTGAFRASWMRKTEILADGEMHAAVKPYIETNLRVSNGHILGDYLEHGTSKMAPRPHHDRIREKAKGAILKIYNEPYY